jgi:hypothetical protein
MFNRKRIVIAAILVSIAFLIGDFETVRVDGQGGWCAHFGSFMVCNKLAATDYTLGD